VVRQAVIGKLMADMIQQQAKMMNTVVTATPHQCRHTVVVMDTSVNSAIEQQLEHKH